MPWTVRLHPDLPIIETCYSGVLAPTELDAAIRENLTLIQSSGRTRLLGDCTALDGGHSVVDLYHFAEAFSASDQARTIKEAVLLPALPASAEGVRFWETACANRGLNVRIFDQRDEALQWLLG